MNKLKIFITVKNLAEDNHPYLLNKSFQEVYAISDKILKADKFSAFSFLQDWSGNFCPLSHGTTTG